MFYICLTILMEENTLIKQLTIVRVIEESSQAKTFVLEPLGNWKPEYKSGQFLTLVFKTHHGEKRRSYSISSAPVLNEPLSITVKKVDNGEFSRLLIQHAKEGDVLYTSGISGFFTLPDSHTSEISYCFLAAGSGITPCFSLIKSLLFGSMSKVVLIYSNRDKSDTIFYTALLELLERFPERLTIHFLFSDSNDLYKKRLSKWLLEQLLEKYLPGEIPQTRFYICGPFEYMQTVEITLLNYTDKDKIVKENFSSFPRLKSPLPPDLNPHDVTIKINGSTHQFSVKYPKTILAEAKERGIELPYSCEAGRCGSCTATCTKGKVWMAYNEVLVHKEVEAGRVLVCQGFPVDGDVELEFE